MKKISIITILAISISLLFASCLNFIAKETKTGDGKLVTKTIDISNFSEIDIETFVKVNFSQEENQGTLEFSVDENLWDYYHIYTKDNVLHVKLKEEYRNTVHLKPTQSLLAVSSELLERIAVAGSSHFYFCTDFNSEKLKIDLAGSSKIVANEYPVTIDQCEIDIAGSANVQLMGGIQKAVIDIAGSGNVEALDCEIAHLQVQIAGSGDVAAQVTDKLEVDIAGSGKVKYKGNPETVKTDVAGSGKIEKL